MSPTALRGVEVKVAAPHPRGASEASSLDLDEHRARIPARAGAALSSDAAESWGSDADVDVHPGVPHVHRDPSWPEKAVRRLFGTE